MLLLPYLRTPFRFDVIKAPLLPAVSAVRAPAVCALTPLLVYSADDSVRSFFHLRILLRKVLKGAAVLM